jgi:ferredoxin
MTHRSTYEALAAALDRLPNRFPRTPSNVEIRLLQKLFTPAEADLVSRLGGEWEPIAPIAARAGLDSEPAAETLLEMAKQGLVWAKKGDVGALFRLAPFVVGIYEAQLARMDPELARLVDDYMSDGGARGIMGAQPAIHRVIPAQSALKPEWILPYDDVRALLESARSFTVRDCVCRTQMEQQGEPCRFPKNVCLIYHSRGTPPSPDAISRDEALALLDEAEEIGLVHTVSNVETGALLPEGVGYVCNCCSCCCLMLRGITKWGIANSVAHAAYYAVIDPEACSDCGICTDRCQIGAISANSGSAVVARARCIGCGLCVTKCPTGAAALRRRPADEILAPPPDFAAWQRARHDRATPRAGSAESD